MKEGELRHALLGWFAGTGMKFMAFDRVPLSRVIILVGGVLVEGEGFFDECLCLCMR